MLEVCRENGGVNDGILRAVESIARGTLNIYHNDLSFADKDDVVQNVLLRFFRRWRCIDTTKKPVAYIGYVVKTEAFRIRRRLNKRRNLITYESELPQESPSIDRYARLERTRKLSVGIICPSYCKW